MNTSQANLLSVRNILIALSVVFLAAVLVFQLFIGKSRDVELYDELSVRISAIRVAMTQLEYQLDMFVLAGRFEETNVGLIKQDVHKLDVTIKEIVTGPRFLSLLKDNGLLSDNVMSIDDDWRKIKVEVAKLDEGLSKDEIMLIHNSVDVNTVLIIEKAEMLLGGVVEARKRLFLEIKEIVFGAVTAFMLFTLMSVYVFYNRFISPLRGISVSAAKLTGGDAGVAFTEATGTIGVLGSELNAMLRRLTAASALKDARLGAMEAELHVKTRQIEALNVVMSCAGKSLATNELLGVLVREAVTSGGADACAAYMIDDGVLKMFSSAGFQGGMPPFDLQTLGIDAVKTSSIYHATRLFKDVVEYPEWLAVSSLKAAGLTSMIASPILYDNETRGVLIAAYRDRLSVAEGSIFFIEALASAAGALTGHVSMIQAELSGRRFMERIMNQVPYGVAVFDGSGACRLTNAGLRKMLGADPRFDFQTLYNVFEDDSLASSGAIASVRKTYEGFSAEFTVDYEPARMIRHGFVGAMRRVKIRTVPIYNAAGEIAHAMLIYEDAPQKQASIGASAKES